MIAAHVQRIKCYVGTNYYLLGGWCSISGSRRMKTFDDWFNEQELFGLRSERLHAIMEEPKQWSVVVKWLEAAYNQGREDQREQKSVKQDD